MRKYFSNHVAFKGTEALPGKMEKMLTRLGILFRRKGRIEIEQTNKFQKNCLHFNDMVSPLVLLNWHYDSK